MLALCWTLFWNQWSLPRVCLSVCLSVTEVDDWSVCQTVHGCALLQHVCHVCIMLDTFLKPVKLATCLSVRLSVCHRGGWLISVSNCPRVCVVTTRVSCLHYAGRMSQTSEACHMSVCPSVCLTQRWMIDQCVKLSTGVHCYSTCVTYAWCWVRVSRFSNLWNLRRRDEARNAKNLTRKRLAAFYFWKTRCLSVVVYFHTFRQQLWTFLFQSTFHWLNNGGFQWTELTV